MACENGHAIRVEGHFSLVEAVRRSRRSATGHRPFRNVQPGLNAGVDRDEEKLGPPVDGIRPPPYSETPLARMVDRPGPIPPSPWSAHPAGLGLGTGAARRAHILPLLALWLVFLGALAPTVAFAAAGIPRLSTLPGGLTPLAAGRHPGAEACARTFALAIEQGDDSRVAEAVDLDALIELVAADLSLGEAEHAGLVEGLRQGLGGLAARMQESAPNGIVARYAGLFDRHGRSQALVRLDLGEHGLNYFELKLARGMDGRVRVYDWYDYAQGTDFSTMVAQLAGLMVRDRASLERAAEVSALSKKEADQLIRFIEDLRTDRYASALATFETMPESLRRSRALLIQRVKAASRVKEEGAYQQALADLARHHGDDPRLALMLADHFFYTGERTRLFESLGRLSRFLGREDAGLVYMDSVYRLLLGDPARAEVAARRAMALEPAYESPYWILVQSLLTQQKYAMVTDTLREMGARFGYTFSRENFEGRREFAEYLESPSFRAWLAVPASAN